MKKGTLLCFAPPLKVQKMGKEIALTIAIYLEPEEHICV